MDSLSLKCCNKCKEKKPPSEFLKYSRSKSGLSSHCRVCVKEYQREHYLANRAENRHKAKIHYAANRTRFIEKNREYSATHAAEARARTARWCEENPGRKTAWRKANLDKDAAYQRKRQALKRGAQGTHTAEDVARQFDAQKGMCWWCGAKLKKSGKGKYHVDHVVALSKGGSNGPENLVCSCPTCNLSKHARSPLDFAGRLF